VADLARDVIRTAGQVKLPTSRQVGG